MGRPGDDIHVGICSSTLALGAVGIRKYLNIGLVGSSSIHAAIHGPVYSPAEVGVEGPAEAWWWHTQHETRDPA